jgi:hypothetical protein
MRWTYANAANWSNCPSWELCSGATVPQSPMDIITTSLPGQEIPTKLLENYSSYVSYTIASSPRLCLLVMTIDNRYVPGNLSNTGHSVQVTLYTKNNTLSGGPFGTSVYALKQFHWYVIVTFVHRPFFSFIHVNMI